MGERQSSPKKQESMNHTAVFARFVVAPTTTAHRRIGAWRCVVGVLENRLEQLVLVGISLS